MVKLVGKGTYLYPSRYQWRSSDGYTCSHHLVEHRWRAVWTRLRPAPWLHAACHVHWHIANCWGRIYYLNRWAVQNLSSSWLCLNKWKRISVNCIFGEHAHLKYWCNTKLHVFSVRFLVFPSCSRYTDLRLKPDGWSWRKSVSFASSFFSRLFVFFSRLLSRKRIRGQCTTGLRGFNNQPTLFAVQSISESLSRIILI